MCIIAIKPIGVDMIDTNIIRAMFNNNPDGSGYMYVVNNQVHIRKGYMTLQALLDSLETLEKRYVMKDIPLILHFRIGTSGLTDGTTCHPFPVTNDLKSLQETRLTTNLGMAHNGVIYDFEERKSNYSDTQLFIKKCVSYLYDLNHDFLNDKRTTDLFESIINGSRLAFLDSNGHIYKYGEWIESDGIYYSNSSYRDYNYTSYSWYDDDDYYSYDEYYECLESNVLDALETRKEITDSDEIGFIRCTYALLDSIDNDSIEIYDVDGMAVKVNPGTNQAIRIDYDCDLSYDYDKEKE